MCTLSKNCFKDFKTRRIKLAGVCQRPQPALAGTGRSWAPPSGHLQTRAASPPSWCWIYTRCAGLSGRTEQSLKLPVLLSIPRKCQTRGGCHWENTVGNSFKSSDWAQVQTTARPNHDKSSVTLQPPCCPPSIFVTSSKAVKVPQSGFRVSRDAQI